MAGLILTLRGKKLSETELPKDTAFTVGREPDNMMVLDNPGVSRHHAQIELLGHHFYLVDLGSTNGTLLNGKRLWKKASLKDNDKIRIGKYDIIFADDPLDYEHLLSSSVGTETIPIGLKKPKK
jgi:pSer/pThr/pTyr-binding forkhead associated (FHA) protein